MDIGCGSGQSTFGLAPHFKKVLGLDISEAQIAEAKKKAAAAKDGGEKAFGNVDFE